MGRVERGGEVGGEVVDGPQSWIDAIAP